MALETVEIGHNQSFVKPTPWHRVARPWNDCEGKQKAKAKAKAKAKKEKNAQIISPASTQFAPSKVIASARGRENESI